MLKNERHDKILELLYQKKYLTVDELVENLHYSPATIRRDITVLAGLGLLKKSYGGVSMATASPPVIIREHENTAVKIKLCQAAAALIKDGDLIYIDGTTTTYFLCEFLKAFKDITIVTNNMKSALYLFEHKIPCYVTGGHVCDTTMLNSSYAAEFIEKMEFDIAFFSIAAASTDGKFAIDDAFTEIFRAALKNTKKAVMLFDGNKLKRKKRYLKNMSAFDYVISDADITKNWIIKFPNTKFINVK